MSDRDDEYREPRWLLPFLWGVCIAAVVAFVLIMGFGITTADAAAKESRWPAKPTMRDVQRLVPDWFGFVRLGRCEQPGPGRYGVYWRHPGPTWFGGLGIYRGTWDSTGTPYPHPPAASMEQVILVADAVRDRYGITAWGAWRCFG